MEKENASSPALIHKFQLVGLGMDETIFRQISPSTHF